MRKPRHKLSLRKLHILVVDLILLGVAVIEGVKYLIWLIER